MWMHPGSFCGEIIAFSEIAVDSVLIWMLDYTWFLLKN